LLLLLLLLLLPQDLMKTESGRQLRDPMPCASHMLMLSAAAAAAGPHETESGSQLRDSRPCASHMLMLSAAAAGPHEDRVWQAAA
jgi:hypothetical protein